MFKNAPCNHNKFHLRALQFSLFQLNDQKLREVPTITSKNDLILIRLTLATAS